MEKTVIFCGMPGSGKSIGIIIAKTLNIPVLVMGDIVREEASRRKLSHTPQTFGQVMLDLRQEFGPAVIAERCIKKLKQLKSLYVVIDGARSEPEITAFKQVIDTVVVVAVHASPKTRFQRLIQRARADDALTWEEFLKRDTRELDIGLGRVIAEADVMLINEGEIKELKQKIIQLLTTEFQME